MCFSEKSIIDLSKKFICHLKISHIIIVNRYKLIISQYYIPFNFEYVRGVDNISLNIFKNEYKILQHTYIKSFAPLKLLF